MNAFMSFMDKIYSDTKALTIVYIIGAALLLLFIIMLLFSLRKPKAKKMNTKILDEPNIKEDKVEKNDKEERIETKEEYNLDAKQLVNEEVKEVSTPETYETVTSNENTVTKALDNVEEKEIIEEVKEEPTKSNISAEIPDVDEFVDSVVQKTYEKNEQFSSVFVGDNTSTMKLDKVLDDLNVDEDIRVDIIPDEEKSKIVEPAIEETTENTIVEEKETAANLIETPKEVTDLDSLKKAMEEKKKEVINKQDELKAKLQGLKQPEKKEDVLKAEDLLNKLNSIKE